MVLVGFSYQDARGFRPASAWFKGHLYRLPNVQQIAAESGADVVHDSHARAREQIRTRKASRANLTNCEYQYDRFREACLHRRQLSEDDY